MHFERFYTKKNHDPYADIAFVERLLDDPPKKKITFVVPENWSIEAAQTIATKYGRRAGVPSKTVLVPECELTEEERNLPLQFRRRKADPDATFSGETDCRQVFDRLAGDWTHWGLRGGYFDSLDDAIVFYDEARAMLVRQMAAPNSPQFFNTGLNWAYGINGNSIEYWHVDPKTGDTIQSRNFYERLTPFACYISRVEDTLCEKGGIFDFVGREARIFKAGSGSGADFSSLRATGEKLSGGGTSSGLMSFLKMFDTAAGTVKSGGTTRRAAKMVVLKADHPDILDFVNWKVREETKVAYIVAGSIATERNLRAILAAASDTTFPADARLDPTLNRTLAKAIIEAHAAGIPDGIVKQMIDLAAQGITDVALDVYDVDWDSESYRTVSAQNANNSVRIDKRFFDAVDADADWNLTARTDGSIMHTIKARELWDAIAMATWRCADPGLQYDDIINSWHVVPNEGRINASNPCAEFLFVDDSACNLASINYVKFLHEDGTFDITGFQYAVRLWTTVLEISVYAGQTPSEDVARNTWALRPLGLGYTNLGAVIMRLGLPYNSVQARTWAAALGALHLGTAYHTSAEMARQIGPFPAFERNREAALRVLRNHARAAGALQTPFENLPVPPVVYEQTIDTANIWQAARDKWDQVLTMAEKDGIRNAQTVVIAPTGTIGILMGSDATGCEPDLALRKYKKLAGGGYMKFVNESIEPALRRLGYRENEIAAISRYVGGTNSLDHAPHVNPDALREMGLSNTDIAAIQDYLPSAVALDYAFHAGTISTETRQRLGITDEEMTSPKFSFLKRLGLNQEDIDRASTHVCGNGHVEGAPFLKPEHLPVFDCANSPIPNGRTISPEGHIEMLAAIQPFVSGGISKTINMPSNATIEDVKRIYRLAYERGVKCIAIYRDGSKLSQPLATSLSLLDGTETEAPLTTPLETAERIVYRYIAHKRSMPNKRSGTTQKFTVNGMRFYVRTGEYPEGTLGEIFIDGRKEGAFDRAMLNNFAIAISIALQHGVPLEEFVEAFVHTRFEPNGLVQDHDHIKVCSSLLDMIFRHLGIEYLGLNDLADIKPGTIQDQPTPEPTFIEEVPGDGRYGKASSNGHQSSTNGHTTVPTTVRAPKPALALATASTQSAKGKLAGYTGDVCTNCGSFRVKLTGSCRQCEACLHSSGGCG
jgi:ribonucleoside-diphosphate reductase alpha chain